MVAAGFTVDDDPVDIVVDIRIDDKGAAVAVQRIQGQGTGIRCRTCPAGCEIDRALAIHRATAIQVKPGQGGVPRHVPAGAVGEGKRGRSRAFVRRTCQEGFFRVEAGGNASLLFIRKVTRDLCGE